MAKDTWPDLSTRQGFIEAIEQAGQYIRDHAIRKNGVQDLRKCKQCIDFLIEEIEPKTTVSVWGQYVDKETC